MSILEISLRIIFGKNKTYWRIFIMKKFLALALAAALALSLVACSSTTEEETTTEGTVTEETTTEETTEGEEATEETTEETTEEDTTEETEGEPVANLPAVTVDGNVYTVVYTEDNADYQAYLTEMTVVVELDDAGALVSVEVTDNQGQLIPAAEEALTSVPAAMVEANSAEVDTVAGATITSEAIKEAVTAALATAQAK